MYLVLIRVFLTQLFIYYIRLFHEIFIFCIYIWFIPPLEFCFEV